MNIRKCMLSAEINSCPYYNSEHGLCTNQGKCSFQEKVGENTIRNGYIREERWYEKYYRKTKK